MTAKKKKENVGVLIGAQLCKARGALKSRIEDVVKETKIRATYIKAMESGEFESLPGGVYTKGYLRSYAKFLGLDGDEIIDKLNRGDEIIEEVPEKEEETIIDATDDPQSAEFSPSLMIIVASIVTSIVIYAVWSEFYDIPEVRDERAQKVLGVLSNPNPTVTIVANDEVTLVIENPSGGVVYEGKMNYGDTYFLPEKDGLIMKAGSQESVELYLDGEHVSTLDNLEKKSDGGIVLDTNKLRGAVTISN